MKRKRVKYTCQCCNRQVDKQGLTQTLSLLPFDGLFGPIKTSYATKFLGIIDHSSGFYQWACDTCLETKKALLGNPKKQYHTFTHPMNTANPNLAYINKTVQCDACQEDFLFSKEEQKYWYEDLQFVVYSKPKQCLTCRKKKQADKLINTELSDLLKDGEPTELKKLQRLVTIYELLEKHDKTKYYLSLIRKKKKR